MTLQGSTYNNSNVKNGMVWYENMMRHSVAWKWMQFYESKMSVRSHLSGKRWQNHTNQQCTPEMYRTIRGTGFLSDFLYIAFHLVLMMVVKWFNEISSKKKRKQKLLRNHYTLDKVTQPSTSKSLELNIISLATLINITDNCCYYLHHSVLHFVCIIWCAHITFADTKSKVTK